MKLKKHKNSLHSRAQRACERTLRKLVNRVINELDGGIDSIIVYGSVARNEATKDSDIDLLIICKDKDKIEDEILNINYDIDLENSTVTTHFYLTPEEMRQNINAGSYFTTNILTEGVVLYDNGIFKGIRQKALGAGRRIPGRRKITP